MDSESKEKKTTFKNIYAEEIKKNNGDKLPRILYPHDIHKTDTKEYLHDALLKLLNIVNKAIGVELDEYDHILTPIFTNSY